jgi:hypothetical protein
MLVRCGCDRVPLRWVIISTPSGIVATGSVVIIGISWIACAIGCDVAAT